MGLLDHQELFIVKGIGKTSGDTDSAEQNRVTLNLMDANTGFSLLEWSPNIPSLKGGGLWADSPTKDGRTLVSGQNTNVTETIRLQLTGSTCQQFAVRFTDLQRMVQDARAFWDTFEQIEPVYLQWWAAGAPGRQYALIYNIDMAVEVEDSTTFQAEVVLTIERELGWRGVRPGGNPKEWTYYIRQEPFDNTKADLATGTDHMVATTIQNRREWNAAQTALLSQNFITFEASQVPGDLDALLEFYCEFGNVPNRVGELYFGRTTKPNLPNSSGVIVPPNYILNAGDALGGTDTTYESDTGAPLSTSAAAARRSRTTFATATADVERLIWNNSTRGYFDFALNRGRYACFARARLSAVGTVTMHLQVAYEGNRIDLPTATLTDVGAGGTGNTTQWGVVYLGLLEVPIFDAHTNVGDDGLGVQVLAAGAGNGLTLSAARTSGSPDLYVSDVILLPIDEGGAAIIQGGTDSLPSGRAFAFDSTGYYTHGMTQDFSKRSFIANTELRGNAPKLKPNVDNHIHFITFNHNPRYAQIGVTMTIRANIVPRWSGIRDR